MRVAYVTADACGSGHAVRGIALVAAGDRAGVEVRAFGPPVLTSVDLTGYEGSADWRIDVLKWQPDLLIGDLRPEPLETLRLQLGVPAWLLMRIWPREWRGAPSWERVVAIEPGAETLPFLTDRIPPIVGRQRVWPEPGQEMQAGYNAFWEASLYGYRVTWAADRPERRTRIEVGGSVSENGADVLVRQAASTACNGATHRVACPHEQLRSSPAVPSSPRGCGP